MISWSAFAAIEPALAAFAAERLRLRPAYLATVRTNGSPRVHPVTPVVGEIGLYVFMEPTSPKGADIRERAVFAMHSGVPDNSGTGGEILVTGEGRLIVDDDLRDAVVEACSYRPEDRYILFELLVSEVRCEGYGDIDLPERRRWRSA